MTKQNFELIESYGKPIKAWIRGVQVDDGAKQQLRNVASLPFIHKHIAVMPDVHWGMGATVGSVIATNGVTARIRAYAPLRISTNPYGHPCRGLSRVR